MILDVQALTKYRKKADYNAGGGRSKIKLFLVLLLVANVCVVSLEIYTSAISVWPLTVPSSPAPPQPSGEAFYLRCNKNPQHPENQSEYICQHVADIPHPTPLGGVVPEAVNTNISSSKEQLPVAGVIRTEDSSIHLSPETRQVLKEVIELRNQNSPPKSESETKPAELNTDGAHFITEQTAPGAQLVNKTDSASISTTHHSNPEKLLTLFTTFKDTGDQYSVHRNTLLNWKVLSPGISPALFVGAEGGQEGWTAEAAALGWEILNADQLLNDVPILRAMFQTLEKRNSDTPFLGYANSDILFDESLLATLSSIKEQINTETTPVLITGRRKNVPVHLIQSGNCLECVRTLGAKTPLWSTDAQDYFIVSKAGFPWEKVPDFIVGWPGYDNWLVAQSILWGVMLIDVSYTVNAIHESSEQGVMSGWQHKDNALNRNMIPPGYDFALGKTECARWKTIRSYNCPNHQKGCVKVVPRPAINIPSYCRPDVTSDIDTSQLSSFSLSSLAQSLNSKFFGRKTSEHEE